ncbi:EAL domain-containing protein [Paraferrimonas sedimenticola]|uniref:Diguanylate cyclase n=1 Tax=Paraferrimonas sedimenticola TaxID=375674 RepID=A0AA37S029_9GAMM|nr:EAL domain-containing protein [Paraferrimonas sedimenticola]GLP97882.1 diguanylate cyclase [Paraferrimonas sedimenticola]
MGFSKTFLLMLSIVLLCVGLVQSHLYVVVAQDNLEQQQRRIAAAVTTLDDIDSDGFALYQQLSATQRLSFFQYAATEDFNRNYTFGQLLEKPSITGQILSWYGANQPKKQFLGRGAVTFRPDSQTVQSLLARQLLVSWIIVLTSLILLGFSFFSAFRRIRNQIRYAANYISRIPSFRFESIEVSRLSNESQPLADALSETRVELKQKIEALQEKCESLARTSNLDAVSGLATRVRFIEQLEQTLSQSQQQIGVLITVRASELGMVNQTQGMGGGDNYLAEVAQSLRAVIGAHPKAEAFRLASSDFAAILPLATRKDAQRFCEALKTRYDDLQASLGLNACAYTAAVCYESGMNALELLGMADTTVNLAQSLGPNSFSIYEEQHGSASVSEHQWQNVVRHVIANRKVFFLQQSIQPMRNDVRAYRELLARFSNENNDPIPTATVIAMAERYGLAPQLDKMIIQNALQLLSQDIGFKGAFAINISAMSAHNTEFVAWLRDTCSKNKALAGRLVFEISEAGLQSNLAASQSFVREVHKTGARVSVERFGLAFTSFRFFREVRPDFIKLAGEYSHGIDQNRDNAFFVRMVVDIARRMGILVFATSVERQQEKMELERLLVDGLQGYYIGQPEVMNLSQKEAQPN